MLKSALAILLAIAALGFATLWVASYFSGFGGCWEINDKWSVTCSLWTGRAFCYVTVEESDSLWGFIWGHHPWLDPDWYSVGVHSYNQRGFRHSGVIFPLWAAFLVTVWFPILVLCRGPIRRRRRRKRGLCLHCGYNLTGVVEPRCPECGKPSAQVSAVATAVSDHK